MKTRLSLETRKRLVVAAETLRQPAMTAVFVAPLKEMRTGVSALPGKVETREQAELRRERVEGLTRKAPEVVITSRWVHTASAFDAQRAVVLKLPLLQRMKQWLRTE